MIDTAQAIQRLFSVFSPSSIELIEVDSYIFEFRHAGHHYVVCCPCIPSDPLSVAEYINDEDCSTRFANWMRGIILGATRDDAGNLIQV